MMLSWVVISAFKNPYPTLELTLTLTQLLSEGRAVFFLPLIAFDWWRRQPRSTLFSCCSATGE